MNSNYLVIKDPKIIQYLGTKENAENFLRVYIEVDKYTNKYIPDIKPVVSDEEVERVKWGLSRL